MATPEETRMLLQVTARLRARFPQAEPDLLERAVDTAFHQLDDARIRDFVEILVEREAADALNHSRV
jgi:hypothetical protein